MSNWRLLFLSVLLLMFVCLGWVLSFFAGFARTLDDRVSTLQAERRFERYIE
jgi:hypothetical protein